MVTQWNPIPLLANAKLLSGFSGRRVIALSSPVSVCLSARCQRDGFAVERCDQTVDAAILQDGGKF
jgi:hypothetical protein